MTSFFILFYIYFGYPLVLWILSKNKIQTKKNTLEALPTVTIIIPAFNEQDCILGNLENKVAQDYPLELLDIIVVSDESEDETDAIVLKFAETSPVPVELIRQIPRQGKTAGVNMAVEQAKGEILVFADANSIYAKDTISNLVNTFADESVGFVTGKMVYTNEDGSMVGDGCSAYMKYENILRSLETRIGSVVGVDGGVDAMRKALFTPLGSDQLPDFVQPLTVVKNGSRVAYQENALLQESALDDETSEFRMRVRVSLRALWALWDMRVLFNPFRFGVFSFQLFSHKLIRYLAFIPMVLMLFSNLLLITEGQFFVLILVGQILFYALAIYGYKKKSDNSLVKLALYFCLINIAAAVSALQFIQGKKIVIWKPRVN